MSKFCQYCGTQLKDDANFCTNCGQKVNNINNPIPSNNLTSNKTNINEYSKISIWIGYLGSIIAYFVTAYIKFQLFPQTESWHMPLGTYIISALVVGGIVGTCNFFNVVNNKNYSSTNMKNSFITTIVICIVIAVLFSPTTRGSY